MLSSHVAWGKLCQASSFLRISILTMTTTTESDYLSDKMHNSVMCHYHSFCPIPEIWDANNLILVMLPLHLWFVLWPHLNQRMNFVNHY